VVIFNLAIQFVNASSTYGIYVFNCNNIGIYYSYLYGSTTTGNAGTGIYLYSAHSADIEVNYFANYYAAVNNFLAGLAYIGSCSTTGSGTTTYGIMSQNASVTANAGNSITGGTAATNTNHGTIV
jgi:hypothetical protein